MSDLHPASWLGDGVEEFKRLPTWGKYAIGGIALLVVYFGIRAYQNKGSTSTNISTNGSLQPTSNTGGSQSPFPMVSTSGGSSVPLLPSNTNPLYDPSGGLIGYQQATTPPSQVGATPNPPTQDPFANFFGLIGANGKVSIAKSGLASDSTYVNSSGQSVSLSTLLPGTDKITQGSNNRVWYSDNGGQHLLTSGTGPAIDPRTNTPYVAPAQGGGFESWQSRMRQLKTYTPQYGDNMNEVALKLGLKGGWKEFSVDTFEHGKAINIPNR